MKISFLTPALTAMLGLALASAPFTAQAQTSTNSASDSTPSTTSMPITSAPTSSAAPAKAKKTRPTNYSGTITAIDAASVTLANTKGTLTLAIDAKTKFRKDKAVATIADFAVGDKITGSYSKDATTGTLTAVSIHKKTPKTPAATPAMTPAASTNAAPAMPATPAAQ